MAKETPTSHEARGAAGENVTRRERGNRMEPRVHRGEPIECRAASEPDEIQKGDVVWYKVGGAHKPTS